MAGIIEHVAQALNKRVKLLHIRTDDGTVVVPLHRYLAEEDSLSLDEMYSLNTLQCGETYVMGLHFGGEATFQLHHATCQPEL